MRLPSPASVPANRCARWMIALATPLMLAVPAFAQDVANAEGLTTPYAQAAGGAAPLDVGPPPSPFAPARKVFYITPGFTVPLNRDDADSDDSLRVASSPVAFVDMRYSPKENWFANVTLYGYLEDRQDWQGDFSYSLGYDDWRPNTFSFVYANYNTNRFDPKEDEPVTRPEYGTISTGYKFLLPEGLKSPAANAGDEGRVNCRVGHHYTPRYETDGGPDRHNKQAASAGCRAPLWRNLFVDLTAFEYVTGEQQPWDPDYTYSFGWFDWRPNHFSVQYTNYSGTRYPWRDSTARAGDFGDGAVTVTYNLAF